MWRMVRFILAAPAKTVGVAALLACGLIAYSGCYTFILTGDLEQIVFASRADAAPAATEDDEREAVQSGEVYLNLPTFAEQLEKATGSSSALSYAQANAAAPKTSAKTRVASLTPLVTITPAKPPVMSAVTKAARWNPPLDKKEAVAHDYLKRVCPEVIKFEGMESAADKIRVQARFMRATTPGQIVGIVRSEIRSSALLRKLGYCPSIMAGK